MTTESLKMEYLDNLGNENKLAQIRNVLLKTRHLKLPSYCYWTSDDLAIESVTERKQWLDLFDTQ